MGSYWVKIDFEKVKIMVKITRNVTYSSIFLIKEHFISVFDHFSFQSFDFCSQESKIDHAMAPRGSNIALQNLKRWPIHKKIGTKMA